MWCSKRQTSLTMIHLLLIVAAAAARKGAAPTPDLLTYQDMEIGALVTYGMATANHTQGCPVGPDPPSPSIFTSGLPPKINTDQWCAAVAAFGGRYATLVAKHICGFTLWPTAAKSGNFTYDYGVRDRDVVRDFAESCSAVGVKLGIYYSVNANAYLNVRNGAVQPLPAGAADGRPVLTQAQYVDIVKQQLGFDGGYSVPGMEAGLLQLLNAKQPHAAVFNGCGLATNAVAWIGTESGHAPYPTWSTQTGCLSGPGTVDGNSYVPKEVDLTLQKADTWFFQEGMGYRPFAELVSIYHDSVGHGANMLLNVAPPHNSTLPAAAMAAYAALGRFVSRCYGMGAVPAPSALAHTSCVSECGTVRVGGTAPMTFDRVLLKEEMSGGHNVLAFELLADGEQIFNGTAVGRSLIVLLQKNVTASAVELRVLDERTPPAFRLLALPDPLSCVVSSGDDDGCDLQRDVIIGGFPLPEVPVAHVALVSECCAACAGRPLACVAFTATPEGGGGYACALLKATGGNSTSMQGAVSGAPK